MDAHFSHTADAPSAGMAENILPPTAFGLKGRVALVCMPWGSTRMPSIAIAILTSCVRAADFSVDSHFFNVKLAERLGLGLYEQIYSSGGSGVHSEWLFARMLFGPAGLGELQNEWQDLEAHPFGDILLSRLRTTFFGSSDLCAKIAYEEIPRFLDDCMEQVDWSQYMAVGFTTTFPQSLASLALAKRIKEAHPEVRIVLGGANVDSEMGVEFIRGFPWIDFVVHGEAEHSFPALLNKIAARDEQSRIPGVSMRRKGELVRGDVDANPLMDLNESPAPDYSEYIRALERAGLHKQMQPLILFESSRGCWWGAKHHCTFCGLNGSTMTYRKKDPQRVYAEIMEMSRKYRCLKFGATDNILAMDFFSELLPRLADQDIDLSLFYEVKANLSREQVRLLKAAGVEEIQPGIESFNSRLLKLMQKGSTGIQNVQILKWCAEFGISPSWSILYGFPGEVAEDYEALPELILRLTHLTPPGSISPVSFDRFSPYFYNREKYGLKLKPWSAYQFIFPESRVDLNKIAYVFDGEWDHSADPEQYIVSSKEAWLVWKKLWRQGNTFCYYEKGQDFLIIHDNRPRRIEGPANHRRICLNGPAAEIYLFCDQRRSLKMICKMFEEKFPDGGGAQKVRIWLDQFVAQGIMYTEEDQYLSLAVRGNCTTG